jgi:hypothetical protein
MWSKTQEDDDDAVRSVGHDPIKGRDERCVKPVSRADMYSRQPSEELPGTEQTCRQ